MVVNHLPPLPIGNVYPKPCPRQGFSTKRPIEKESLPFGVGATPSTYWERLSKTLSPREFSEKHGMAMS
jgi:hypothetical protein